MGYDRKRAKKALEGRMLKTSLNKIRDNHPCKDSWEKLLKYLGKTKADDDELSILTILDSNGIEDAIWCLRAVDGHDDEINAFARFCAKQNVEKIKPYCTEEAYTLILNWLETGDTEIEEVTRLAAESAAESAAGSAAWSMARPPIESATAAAAAAARLVVWLVAWSETRSTSELEAWSVARSAAWSAVRVARSVAWFAAESAVRLEQESFLRRIIENG